jgi:hypothetical protein
MVFSLHAFQPKVYAFLISMFATLLIQLIIPNLIVLMILKYTDAEIVYFPALAEDLTPPSMFVL